MPMTWTLFYKIYTGVRKLWLHVDVPMELGLCISTMKTQLKNQPEKFVGRSKLLGGRLTVRQTPFPDRQNSITYQQTSMPIHEPRLEDLQGPLYVELMYLNGTVQQLVESME